MILNLLNLHAKYHCGTRDFFLCPQGPIFRPLSRWDLPVGDFLPNLKKKSQSKKIFFFLEFSFSHHTHTHKLHDDNLLELHPIFLQFNGNSSVQI